MEENQIIDRIRKILLQRLPDSLTVALVMMVVTGVTLPSTVLSPAQQVVDKAQL